MDVIMDTQFQRLETALNTLIDSITSFNPSPQAALDLLAVDDDLAKALEQLAIHQENYARIISLRQTVGGLNGQVKSTLSTLADTRKELLETPATTFSSDVRDIPYEELLSYSKFIGRYTVPPGRRPAKPEEQPTPALEPKDGQDNAITNGTNTPAAPAEMSEQPPKEGEEPPGEEPATTLMQNFQKELEDQVNLAPMWEPWPTWDLTRRGNLGRIQWMHERGIDPSHELTPEEQARLQGEADDQARARMQYQQNVLESRRQQGASQPAQPAPQQPPDDDEFELYNPDEDD